MAPKELILTITPTRLKKLAGGAYGQSHIPIRIKGAGHDLAGGMLTVAGQHGGMLTATGAGQDGGNLMSTLKKASAVASPLAMLAGPEALPLSAGLAAFAGSGKKKQGVSKKQGKKIKKGVSTAAEIAALIAQAQGHDKHAETISQVGKVIGRGKNSKKVKNTVSDLASIAALLGQSSGYMTPQQAAATNAIGSLIQGSGPQHLTGDVFHPPEAVLPPRARGARPKIAVGGGEPAAKKKPRFAVG